MSQLEKKKARIIRKPTSKDVTSEELQSFLKSYGFILKRVNGDHFIYEHTKLKLPMPSIPMTKHIKPTYIDMLREIINEIDGEE